jgi:hypothetical protein
MVQGIDRSSVSPCSCHSSTTTGLVCVVYIFVLVWSLSSKELCSPCTKMVVRPGDWVSLRYSNPADAEAEASIHFQYGVVVPCDPKKHALGKLDHEPDPHSNTLLPACVESPLWRGAMRYTDKIIEWCLGSGLAIFMDPIMKSYQTPTRRRPFPPPSPRIRTSIKNACDMLIERTRGCASSFVAIEHELSEILGRLNEVQYTSGPVTKLVSLNLFHLAQPHLRSSYGFLQCHQYYIDEISIVLQLSQEHSLSLSRGQVQENQNLPRFLDRPSL